MFTDFVLRACITFVQRLQFILFDNKIVDVCGSTRNQYVFRFQGIKAPSIHYIVLSNRIEKKY